MKQKPARGRGYRNIYCQYDPDCLELAARQDWRAFNCESCRLNPHKEVNENMEDNSRNNLSDLNNHLFTALDRLNAGDLTGEELKHEILRAKSVSFVASQIIANGRLALDAATKVNEFGVKNPPRMLGINASKK